MVLLLNTYMVLLIYEKTQELAIVIPLSVYANYINKRAHLRISANYLEAIDVCVYFSISNIHIHVCLFMFIHVW